MTEQEFSFYFPYVIEKQNNFRHFVNKRHAFCKRQIPGYDGTNTQEFLYNKSGLKTQEINNFEYLFEKL
jgi:hypothetical protein